MDPSSLYPLMLSTAQFTQFFFGQISIITTLLKGRRQIAQLLPGLGMAPINKNKIIFRQGARLYALKSKRTGK